jgi:hypothetical protein
MRTVLGLAFAVAAGFAEILEESRRRSAVAADG